MPRCPRCPDVWAKRKHPGRPDTKPDGLHPGCLDIWASGLLPSLHPGIRRLASSGQGQTSGSSWRAWTPARIQVHLGEPRRGLNGPIRASGLAWFVWPETPGCTVMIPHGPKRTVLYWLCGDVEMTVKINDYLEGEPQRTGLPLTPTCLESHHYSHHIRTIRCQGVTYIPFGRRFPINIGNVGGGTL